MFIIGGGRESIVSAGRSSTSKGSGDCPVELNAHNTKLHFSEITKYTFNLPLSINKYTFLHINRSTHYKKNQKNSKTTAEIPKNDSLTECLLSLLYIQQLILCFSTSTFHLIHQKCEVLWESSSSLLHVIRRYYLLFSIDIFTYIY